MTSMPIDSVDPIEPQIAAGVRAWTDQALEPIDAVAIARHTAAAAGRRRRPLARLSRDPEASAFASSGLTVWFAIVAVVLSIALVGSVLVVGGYRLEREPSDLLPDRGSVEPFMGLPPTGAATSKPETGDLLFSFIGRVRALGGDVHAMWVYADGRLIWERNLDATGPEARRGWGATEPTTGAIEQRLTVEGAELLRSQVASAWSPGASFDLRDAGAWEAGVWWGQLMVNDGGQLRTGRWQDPALPAKLVDPASWLPASAWLDQRIRGYVPSSYAVCFDSSKGLPEGTTSLLVSRSTAIWFGDSACRRVTTDDARAVVATLADAGLEPRIWPRVPGPNTLISIIPILPDGEWMFHGS